MFPIVTSDKVAAGTLASLPPFTLGYVNLLAEDVARKSDPAYKGAADAAAAARRSTVVVASFTPAAGRIHGRHHT
jgi:hypothetical protein